jgi:hypothetical protein
MKLPTIRIFLLLVAIGVLPACDQSTSTTDDHRELGSQQPLQAEDRFVISGVSSKGPIRGATINIYAMDANGNKTGNSLATTTTDNNGFWSVSLNPAPTEILLVESSNGSYVDEADPSTPKRTIDIAANEILEGVIFPGQSTSSITLLTDALLEKSRNESTSTNIQVVLANNRNNAISGLGFDPFGVAAANPLAPSAGASVDAIEYAMYLGGVATALNTAAIVLGEPVPNYAIMMGLVRDLSDGRLDGQDKDGAFSVNIDGIDRPFPAGINLNQAILRFRNNNFSAYESTPVSAPVQVSEAAIAQPGTNTFPIALDDATTTPSATSININVLSNDSDADGDALTASIVSQPSNGTLTSSINGVFVYTPNNGFSGADSFEYNINDGKGGNDTAQVTISVLAGATGTVNAPPTVDAGIAQNVNEQSSVTLTGTASDIDGSIASRLWTQTGSGPTVVLNNATTLTPSFTSPTVTALTFLQFTLTVTDNAGATAADTVSIIVSPVNASPVADAGPDQAVSEQTPVTLSSGPATADPDGSIASFQWTQLSGTNVSATLTGANTSTASFTTPVLTSPDVLLFSLVVTDNEGFIATDTVSIIVTPVNVAPIADAGANQNVSEEIQVTLTSGPATTDPDGSIASFQWTQLNGTDVSASLTGANTATASFTAPTLTTAEVLLFSLTVTDNEGAIGVDTVSVIVTPVNVAPTANAGADQIVNELTPVTLTGISNDADGGVASVQWTQLSGTDVSASISGANTNTLSFTSPLVLLNSTDILVFQYQATDSEGLFAADFVTVIVNPVAVAPVANAGIDQTVNEQTLATLDGTASSDDISIASFDWVQLTPVSPVAVLSDATAASPTFTVPDIANDTAFTFRLTVTDNEGGSASDTVVINAISDNLGPTVVDDVAATSEDTPVVITNLLVNDTDPNGNNTPFAIATVTQPANGSVVIEANGTDVTYTPNLNFNGADTFTYTSRDSLGANSVNSASVTVNVSQVNDNPVANADGASTIQAFALTLSNLLDNDTDPEGDTLSLSGIASQPANGTVVNNGNGTLTYTPVATFFGDDSFSYSIVDGNGGSAIGSVTITVVPDTDGDGVINTQELTDGTNPNLEDSDGDGFFDGHEKLVGTDPLLNTSFPPTTTISAANANNDIGVDTTWALINSPYLVLTDVSIRSGATLTIEPGVVVKFADNIDIFVNANATLNAVGNVATPQHVVFTSDDDDSINGDTNGNGVTSVPAHNDWQGIDFQLNSNGGTLQYATVRYAADCISITDSQPVLDNVDIGDCGRYGIIFGNSSGTRNANLSNIEIIDYNGDGTSTFIDGIQITSSFVGITNLVISNISMNEPGDSTTSEHGLDLIAINSGDFIGTIDNVSIVNPASDGFNINNQGTGTVNITLSNLSSNGAGANSLDVRQTSTGPINLTFDGTNSFTNGNTTTSAVYFENNNPDFLASSSTSIDTAGYALNLNGSTGNFRNFTSNNISIAGLLLQGGTDPVVFSNMVLTNAPTPYELVGSSITPTINAGYDFSDASVAKTHVRIGSTFTGDMDLAPDPLGLGSVYRVVANIIVNTGTTFSIQDGVIIKFDLNTSLTVNGDLAIGDGDGAGTDVVLTSFRDNSFGANISDGTAPVRGNWNQIFVGSGASVSIDNALIRYADYGLYQNYVAPASPVTVTNSRIEITDFHGIFIGANTGDGTALNPITWNLDNVTFFDIGRDNRYNGIDIDADVDSHITGTWTNLTMNLVRGSGIFIDDATSGTVNPTIAGLTIGNTDTIGLYGIELVGDSTTAPIFTDTVNTVFIGTNAINGGLHNLFLNGVSGSYADLVLSGASRSSVYIRNAPAPTLWEDSTIFFNSAPAPYWLISGLPSQIGTLGTADLGYAVGSTVTTDYVALGDNLNGTNSLTNAVLPADPLGAGSVYWVQENITIPSGSSVTLDDGVIVKFSLTRTLTVNGSLTIGDGDGAGTDVVLTSFRDNSFGANISDGTAPVRGNWDRISVGSGASVTIDNALIRYSDYGLYQNYVAPASPVTITNSRIELTDFHGIFIGANTGDGTALNPITWNLDNVTFFDIGRDNRYNGIDIDADVDSHITGTWTNLTMNLVRGSGIFIDDATSGTVNPTIAGLTIGNTDTIGLYGIELVGDSTTAPIFTDTVNTVFIGTNAINGGLHNLFLNGVSGSYADLVLSGASLSALYFQNDVTPTIWDSATIILDNSPSPYTLFGTNLPSIATIPISYSVGSAALIQDFVRLYGSLTTDLTLNANPLGLGTYYLVTQTNLTVPSTRTFTVQEGAILKFDASRFLQVQNGGLLLVNGTSANPVIMTSATDDVIGDPSTSGASVSDWAGISFEAGSAGTINFLHTWYGSDGILITNSSPSINDLTVNYSQEGVRINGTTGASPSFSNLAINECTSTHLFLEGTNLSPTFTGVLTITDIDGTNATRGIYTRASSIFTVSGFQITGSNTGIELENGSVSTRFDGNVIRQAAVRGILHQAGNRSNHAVVFSFCIFTYSSRHVNQ